MYTHVFEPDIVPGKLYKIVLNQPDLHGEVVPGTSLAVSPSITNDGTEDALAYISITLPTYGASAAPAYKYTVDSDWILVEDKGYERIYGYKTVLGGVEETSVLTDELTMVDMETKDFMGMDQNVKFKMIGYLAYCEAFGRDIEDGWKMVKEML